MRIITSCDRLRRGRDEFFEQLARLSVAARARQHVLEQIDRARRVVELMREQHGAPEQQLDHAIGIDVIGLAPSSSSSSVHFCVVEYNRSSDVYATAFEASISSTRRYAAPAAVGRRAFPLRAGRAIAASASRSC